jgi:hypothetical protein
MKGGGNAAGLCRPNHYPQLAALVSVGYEETCYAQFCYDHAQAISDVTTDPVDGCSRSAESDHLGGASLVMRLRQSLWYLMGLGRMRSGTHSLAIRIDPAWAVVPWMALLPGIFLSGLLLHRIPPCRMADRRGSAVHLRIGSRYRMAAIGNDVVFGLGMFISWLFLFGLTVGRHVYAIVKMNWGIDIGQFSSICTFSMVCSVFISFAVYILYLCVNYLRRRSDPILARQAAKYEQIGEMRKKHQKSYDDSCEHTS